MNESDNISIKMSKNKSMPQFRDPKGDTTDLKLYFIYVACSKNYMSYLSFDIQEALAASGLVISIFFLMFY